jgi:ubiquinone/menaquinone biosynthesis C-methylase UbiE
MTTLAAASRATLTLIVCVTACGPTMIVRDGHRVFNPAWAWALEFDREDWQKPDDVLRALALPKDAVVADIGAGGGYFTERLSRALPAGHVFATDVQAEMIERLNDRVCDRGLANVTVVQAPFDDPGLPGGCCDLVFFSSVYKEIDERIAYMRKVRKLLRSGGRVAILEFRPEAPGAGPPAAVRLVPKQVISELAQAGFVLLETHDFLPREYFLVFGAARVQ